MDFDSIISLFFIFIFFILPVILKKIQAKNKTATPGPSVKKKASLFERVGKQIQQFVKDLEQQAKAEKETAEKQDGIWERLAGDERMNIDTGRLNIETQVSEKRSIAEDWESPPEKMIKPVQTVFRKKKEALSGKAKPYSQPCTYALNSREKLRQTVVWSEILSKPAGLS